MVFWRFHARRNYVATSRCTPKRQTRRNFQYSRVTREKTHSVDIRWRLLNTFQRLSWNFPDFKSLWYLSAPQLDGPVKGRSDKQVGKVQGPRRCVTVDPRDGSMVALKHLTDACFAVEHRLVKGSWQTQLSVIHLIPGSSSCGLMTFTAQRREVRFHQCFENGALPCRWIEEAQMDLWWTFFFYINHLRISCDYQQGWQKCL